jgi:hypothetical protein
MEIVSEIITGTINMIGEIINSASKIGINTIIPFVCINIIALFYIFSFVYADRKIKELDKKEIEDKATRNADSLFCIFDDRVSTKEEIDITAARLIEYLERKSALVKFANGVAVTSIFLMIIFAFVYAFVSAAFNEFTGATYNDFLNLIVITLVGIFIPNSILEMAKKKENFTDFNVDIEAASVRGEFCEFDETEISAEEARRIMSNDVAKDYIMRVARTGRKITYKEFGMLMAHVDDAEVTADIEAVKEIIYGKEFKQRNV